MKVDLKITNCRIVKPDQTLSAGLAIKDGQIVMIAPDHLLPEAVREIDAGGDYVLPGFIDPHMHVDWPDWDLVEATEASTKAAAAGGYTTVIDFLSCPGSLAEFFTEAKTVFEAHSYVDAGFHMAIFTVDQIEEIPKMADLGVSSFKFFLPYRGSEVVLPLVGIDDGIVYLGFREIAKLGYPARALVHCENIEIVFKLKDLFMKAGSEARVTWDDVRPPVCEYEAIGRMVAFSEDTGCPFYIVHMSTKEGVRELKKAKERGIRATGETCVQYLTLTADDVDRTLGKVNPPLRKDRVHAERLWEALEEGIIECIGSDHAPCARKHKTDFWTATVGMAGIQTLIPVLLSEGVNKGRITINKVAEVCSYNVARNFGLLPRKGVIEVGADADLAVVDLTKKSTVRADRLYHISDFSPFEGWELTGSVRYTILRGRVILEDGEFTGKTGLSKFIPRPLKNRRD
ncbi:MAG: amidohydrolase family protein [Deltaproteobacteria bacterium]|nr:amidohydrolase family protein [Deltaproteobacteria bacterium]MBW2121774.1 amidohydrolase family protein [Deltaproteobacteria bacterium]